MDTITMTLDIPRDLVVALNAPHTQVEERIRELIAIGLFQEGQISAGKGAEILGVSKLAFIQLLAQRGIPYFNESPAELVDDVAVIKSLLDAESS